MPFLRPRSFEFAKLWFFSPQPPSSLISSGGIINRRIGTGSGGICKIDAGTTRDLGEDHQKAT
jgi:hypothetical protein